VVSSGERRAYLSELADVGVVDEARVAQGQLLGHRRVALLVAHHVAPQRQRHGHGVLPSREGERGQTMEPQVSDNLVV
jgi:hypothetical protein